jgi:hypothetical protein
MQVKVNIGFEQLLEIAKSLPAAKAKKLSMALEKAQVEDKKEDLKDLLLNGPVATEEDMERIANNRKAFSKWRTT